MSEISDRAGASADGPKSLDSVALSWLEATEAEPIELADGSTMRLVRRRDETVFESSPMTAASMIAEGDVVNSAEAQFRQIGERVSLEPIADGEDVISPPHGGPDGDEPNADEPNMGGIFAAIGAAFSSAFTPPIVDGRVRVVDDVVIEKEGTSRTVLEIAKNAVVSHRVGDMQSADIGATVPTISASVAAVSGDVPSEVAAFAVTQLLAELEEARPDGRVWVECNDLAPATALHRLAGSDRPMTSTVKPFVTCRAYSFADEFEAMAAVAEGREEELAQDYFGLCGSLSSQSGIDGLGAKGWFRQEHYEETALAFGAALESLARRVLASNPEQAAEAAGEARAEIEELLRNDGPPGTMLAFAWGARVELQGK